MEKQSSITFQEIKKILREVSISQKETDRRMKETDRRMKETAQRIKETDLMLKHMSKETDRRIKKLDALFTGQWGKLIEALVHGDFKRVLKSRGIVIQDLAQNIEGDYKNQKYEFDIMATNGNLVILCEVKTTLMVNDVKAFIKKLECFDTWKPKYKSAKIYGSVAYLKANQHSASFAEKQGLFVIKAVGGSALLVNSVHFKPKEFSSTIH